MSDKLQQFGKQIILGEKLSELRKQHDMTIKQAAECIGVSTNYLSELERGVKSSSDELLRTISHVYNVAEWELFVAGGRIPLLTVELLHDNLDFAVQLAKLHTTSDDVKQKAVAAMCKTLNSVL